MCPFFTGKRKDHRYQTLQQTLDGLMTNFNVLLKKCSETITQTCKAEKETWQTLDQVEEECDDLMRQVKAKADALVSQRNTHNYNNIIIHFAFSSAKLS